MTETTETTETTDAAAADGAGADRTVHVSDTEAYDLSDEIAEIKARFRGEQWRDCEAAACEHARSEAHDIAQHDGLSPAVQDEIESRLVAAAAAAAAFAARAGADGLAAEAAADAACRAAAE